MIGAAVLLFVVLSILVVIAVFVISLLLRSIGSDD